MALFKPGQSGNPGGKKPLPDHLKKFKHMSYAEFLELMQKYSSMTKEQLLAKLKDPTSTNFEIIVARIVQGAMGRGEKQVVDKDARDLLINRLWGKVPDVSHIHNTNVAEMIDGIPRENILDYLRKAKDAT